AESQDPGRARYTPFFQKIYGDCTRKEAQTHFRQLRWLPPSLSPVQFTRVNGAALALEAVIRDLQTLPPETLAILSPRPETYHCRNILNTTQASMHSYGIAIDVAPENANYWELEKDTFPQYRNAIPYEIVEIFERHGFIWGGKWYHYDTMHFEYRPELLPELLPGFLPEKQKAAP
ncbi:MAG: M15 family metallopeptidase, partial [Rickettsiales bacterium]|nr:M15 family metallopeptidase [Rickettsiales bacterium]